MQPDEIYRVLGVAPDADAETVKQAYRALAARYHPDRNPSDAYAEQKFAEATQAYAAWAGTHAPAEAAGSARSAAPPNGTPIEDIFGAFQDLFGDFFGGAKGQVRGADLVQPLKVSYVEARDGAKRSIEIARRNRCGACDGSGARDGESAPCHACTGSGRTQHVQGFFAVQATCSQCAGSGRIVANPCAACEHGLVRRAATLDVTVPPGVKAGMRLRFAGKGDEHPSGPPGNLYLEIVIDNTDVLVRDGDDVTFETCVPVRRAVLGGALEVDTLDGRATVQVPPLVRDGAVLTLAGRGHRRGVAAGGDPYRGELARGDQRVILRLSPQARQRRRQVVAIAVAVVIAIAIAALALI